MRRRYTIEAAMMRIGGIFRFICVRCDVATDGVRPCALLPMSASAIAPGCEYVSAAEGGWRHLTPPPPSTYLALYSVHVNSEAAAAETSNDQRSPNATMYHGSSHSVLEGLLSAGQLSAEQSAGRLFYASPSLTEASVYSPRQAVPTAAPMPIYHQAPAAAGLKFFSVLQCRAVMGAVEFVSGPEEAEKQAGAVTCKWDAAMFWSASDDQVYAFRGAHNGRVRPVMLLHFAVCARR